MCVYRSVPWILLRTFDSNLNAAQLFPRIFLKEKKKYKHFDIKVRRIIRTAAKGRHQWGEFDTDETNWIPSEKLWLIDHQCVPIELNCFGLLTPFCETFLLAYFGLRIYAILTEIPFFVWINQDLSVGRRMWLRLRKSRRVSLRADPCNIAQDTEGKWFRSDGVWVEQGSQESCGRQIRYSGGYRRPRKAKDSGDFQYPDLIPLDVEGQQELDDDEDDFESFSK